MSKIKGILSYKEIKEMTHRWDDYLIAQGKKAGKK